MKRLLQLTLVLCLLLSLTVPAFAAETFPTVAAMTADTFTDVAPTNWFYPGVKTAYDLGIMNGVTPTSFDPAGRLNWAMAVTIAARVRAASMGEEIPAVEGAWYLSYARYAQACDILPADAPAEADWPTTPIDRQTIAYLFQAVVPGCPPISDLRFPDLDEVDADKREAVLTLYAAGIFTGRDDGSFDPKGYATRGELATILSRLLRPAYRVGHDERVNAAMRGQESNLTIAGVLYSTADADYLIYRDNTDLEGATERILRRDKATDVTTDFYVMTEEGDLSNLSGEGEWVCFMERLSDPNKGYLRRINTRDGTMETLYTTGWKGAAGTYLFYDGRLFLEDSQLLASGDWEGRVYEIQNGKAQKLLSLKDNIESIYAWNSKLFVLSDNTLYAYDLSTRQLTSHIENICASAFCDGKIYYTLWVDGDWNGQVYLASLDAPTKPIEYAVLPESALVLYPDMVHTGDALYFLGSGSRVLYHIREGLPPEAMITNRWWTSDSPLLWDDCYLEGNPGLGVGNYVGEYGLTTGLGTAAQQTTNVDHWLGRSALMARRDFPATGAVYETNEAFSDDPENRVAVRRIYYSGDQLVLDIGVRHTAASGELALSCLNLTVSAKGQPLAEQVIVTHNDYIKPGNTLELTAVIQGGDLLASGVDLSEVDYEIGMMYRLTK